MTGFNLAMLAGALAVLGTVSDARPRLPSPVTWMREKQDVRLDTSLKEYLGDLKEDQDGTEPQESETKDGEEQPEEPKKDKRTQTEIMEALKNIRRGEGKVVKFHQDTILSDYIAVNSWVWDDREPLPDSKNLPPNQIHQQPKKPASEEGQQGEDTEEPTRLRQDDGESSEDYIEDDAEEGAESKEGEDKDVKPTDDSQTADKKEESKADKRRPDADIWEDEFGTEEMLYFVLVESRSEPETDPLVIWLQGGPGCSSMLGLYTENGPYWYRYRKGHAKEPFELEYNEHSWNSAANVMYVDQPLGTGFSFINSLGSLRWSEGAIAEDFYNFLHNFMAKYPEYRGREVFITGESYAGHYIPNIARNIQLKEDPWINLAGVAIGNGWVDPLYQYPEYPHFAAMHGLISYGHSMVLRFGYEVCQFALIFHIPFVTMTLCQMVGMSILAPGLPDFNVYDIRLPCERMGLCYPDDHLWQMLNTVDYRELMSIPAEQGDLWEECASLPHLTLLYDWDNAWGYSLAPLLDAGVPVLIYSGDMDYICNWMGGFAWTNALVWDGQQEFRDARMLGWQSPSLGNDAAGSVKNFENFTFMRVFQAGHMVPMDQPEAALDMLSEFINTKKITPTIAGPFDGTHIREHETDDDEDEEEEEDESETTPTQE